MLSGEGNENGEKTTIGLISKKATLHVQHTCTKTSDKKYRTFKQIRNKSDEKSDNISDKWI